MVPIFQVLSTVLLRAVGRRILIAKDNVCLTQEEPAVQDETSYIHVSVITGGMKFPNQITFMNIQNTLCISVMEWTDHIVRPVFVYRVPLILMISPNYPTSNFRSIERKFVPLKLYD